VLKKIGDNLLILFVLIIVVLGIIGNSDDGGSYDSLPPIEEPDTPLPEWVEAQPTPLPGKPREGGSRYDDRRVLPPPSAFDDQTLVEAEDTRNWTSGTAFAIASSGIWFTARHVVIGCDRVVVLDRRGRIATKAEVIFLSDNADVALVRTRNGPAPLALDLDERDLKLGTRAFHVGYPQGKPGEVTSRLIGRELMVTSGAWQGREQTLAFAETGRTAGLNGTLGGLSGGPAFDEDGNVIGVTVAESPRRGRIVTTSAVSLVDALNSAGITPSGTPQGDLGAFGYANAANQLRTELKVIQLVCMRGR
jgi:serine protease Do